MATKVAKKTDKAKAPTTPSADEAIARLRSTGRNDSCPCGSGKKYKKCHLREDEDLEKTHLDGIQKENARQAEADAKAHDAGCEDPQCKEEHGKPKSDSPKVKAAASVAARPAPKGPAAAASQRTMPRKSV